MAMRRVVHEGTAPANDVPCSRMGPERRRCCHSASARSIWRARWAEGRPRSRWAFRLRDRVAAAGGRRGPRRRRRTPRRRESHAAPARGPARPVVVIRIPRLRGSRPNMLDRYVGRLYARTAALAFVGLLGIFYISTFIDKSEKMFKGQATGGKIVQLLGVHDAAVRLLRHSARGAAERARDVRHPQPNERADGHEGVRHQPVPGRRPADPAGRRRQPGAVRPGAARHGAREPARGSARRADPGTAPPGR